MSATVFLSYSHRDEPWKDRVLAHLAERIGPERLTIWNDRRIAPGSEWFVEIETAMNAAAVAVCLISENFLLSEFCTQYEVAPLLARRERHGLLLVPVLVSPCRWDTVHWLKPIQMLPRDGRSLAADPPGGEQAALEELAAYVARALDDPAHRPPPPTAPPPVPAQVDLGRLPYTGFEVVGRDAQLARLNLAWRSFDTNVVCLHGWGGVGKSTVVNKWLESMESAGFEGAEAVFGWSFATQPGETRQASAEPFVQAALAFFGDPSPAGGSPWAKGERLAARIADRRSLLVLDGLESVQSALPLKRGTVTDPALATLLVELAQRNSGLCVITTREQVADLAAYAGTVAQEDLEMLSDRAGRAVLRLSGVCGDDTELEEASRSFGGHALALRLFAGLLREAPARVRERVHALIDAEAVPATSPIERLLDTLDAQLGDGAPREILRALSIAGDSVDAGTLNALLREPAVAGWNDAAAGISAAGWQASIRELRRRALLAVENEREPDQLETHPVVCDHFANGVRRASLRLWRQANLRLAAHYSALGDAVPVTLADAAPTLRAVRHGALCGEAGSAIALFHERLDRHTNFWANRLGAPGEVLATLSAFFRPGGWSTVPELPVGTKGYLLNATGTALRALGRFEDAIDVYAHALDVRKAEESWQPASKNASNLAEVALVVGRIPLALASAEESIELAWRSDDAGQVIYCLTTLADVLHQAGAYERAAPVFERAEQLHGSAIAGRGHPMPVLYRLPGIRFGEFMIATGSLQRFMARARFLVSEGPDISQEEEACGGVLCAEAVRAATVAGDPAFDLVDALHIADNALASLRASSSEVYLPRALLARARIHAALGDTTKALRDADRALVVARRNGAKLFVIDATIEKSRIERDAGNRDSAARLLDEARASVESLGYLRRKLDIEELAASL